MQGMRNPNSTTFTPCMHGRAQTNTIPFVMPDTWVTWIAPPLVALLPEKVQLLTLTLPWQEVEQEGQTHWSDVWYISTPDHVCCMPSSQMPTLDPAAYNRQ
jgi:hypothetical protein